jgi:hypothetical protein
MSLKPFPVITGNAALTTVPVCCKLGSISLIHCIAVNTSFLLAIFKGVGNVFARVTYVHHIKQIHLLHVIRELMVTNDDWQINCVPL